MTDTAEKHSAPKRIFIHSACMIRNNGTSCLVFTSPAPVNFRADQSEYTRSDVAQAETAAAVERAVLAERARCAEIADNRMDACEDEERRDQDGIGRSCYLEAQLIYERIMAPPDAGHP